MFSLKSISTLFLAATSIVSALPAPHANPALSIAKREAASVYAYPAVAAAAPVAVNVRDAELATVPAAVNKCKDTVNGIFVKVDAAIKVKASVDVFVGLYADVVVAIKDLTADITALVNVGADVDILAGLTIEACAKLVVDLFLAIAVKLQATVSVLGLLNIHLFLDVFLQICAALTACIHIIAQVVVGINVYLNVQLSACISILLSLCLSLGVNLDIVATLRALLAL